MRFSYAARQGVSGNGWNIITWDCEAGRCKSQHVEGHFSDVDRESWRSECDSGPVRISLTKRGNDVTRLRTYVGGTWRAAAGATDLGTASAPEAARYLLSLARAATSGARERAIFAATLADSVILGPDLLRIARDTGVPRRTRRTAVFWLGQAAEQAATQGLDDLVAADTMDREIREAAVFALSQRPREEGVPALIRIAHTHRDPEVRRKAIFWLGQSDDSRALALFEELLTRP
ncbi:MAG TPA: HEAT repeat domain-containing protein [Gemmatimonadales bacterium]|nr:HEAT repeat domain-containing protein [Gemmatimonadales bacterium]